MGECRPTIKATLRLDKKHALQDRVMSNRVTSQSKRVIKRIQVSREEFLKARPLRHPGSECEEDEKGLHVKVPRRRAASLRLFSKLLPLSQETRVLLDKQGAFVWGLCDGEHRIKEIARKLSEEYSLRVSDAEAALDLYLVQLSKSGLVGFVLPESAKKRYHRRFGKDNTEKDGE